MASFLRLAFLCFFFCLCLSSTLGSPLPRDAITLLSFKASIADPLLLLSSWSSSSINLSSWFGTSFDHASSSLLALSLPSCNLSGSLPPSLGNLSSLRLLQLADNNFSGPIPPQIYGLPSLVSLNLSFNWLSGSIPRRFRLMPRLRELDLNTNCLIGGIPEDIAGSLVLEKLDLGGNSLGGTIPAQLGTLSNLINFTAYSNNISGEIPSSLGNLTKLQWLYLGWNRLSGQIPQSLASLQELLVLDLSSNALSGSIPPQLGRLQSLKALRLFTNQLTGEIPRELGNLTNLLNLDLAMNSLHGALPEQLSSLTSIELIHLFANNLSGDVPSWIADLPYLYDLKLYNNFLTGELPQSLGRNIKLQLLDVSQNSLSGTIPPDLCAGSSLIALVMFSNQLSGSIPDSIINCPSLIRLRLENNLLNGSFPKIVTPPRYLQYLRICNNSLTGSIPAELGNASSLGALLLSQNQFDGELPIELEKLHNLVEFDASENNLVGSFPLQICANKPGFSDLTLGSNAFAGPIPSEISLCNGLHSLYLDNNRFDGFIPAELGKLPTLGYLDLSVNKFSGIIPITLSTSQALVSINVSFNRLSGSIPDGGAFTNLSASDYVGNLGLCGNLEGVRPCHSGVENLAANPDSGSDRRELWVLPSACLAVLLCLLASVICLYRKCNRICQYLERQNTRANAFASVTMFQNYLVLTDEDIVNAISENNVIGRGGSGIVYKGVTKGGDAFVVKKLWAREEACLGSGFYDHGYRAEVETLGGIRHRSIVRLLCCWVTRECDFLVYEFMPNGSLADMLHDKTTAGILNWELRYNIAVDIAQGLAYLHHDCVPPILHRDVKSNNVLLDANFVARLSDFGLAKSLQGPASQLETMSVLAGSCGYIAPEYAYTMKASDKCDVYSFGVVLLELVTGRKPAEMACTQSESLANWVTSKLQKEKEVVHVVDVTLGHLPEHVKQEAMWVLKVGLLCTHVCGSKRPSMREVVEMLLRPRVAERTLSSKTRMVDLKKLVEKEDEVANQHHYDHNSPQPYDSLPSYTSSRSR